jgi:hypothetical protein
MNLCRSCGHDFASVKAFDAHRTGKHAYTHREGLLLNPSRDDGRRCLTPSEMRTAGWETNRWGRWVHPSALRNRPPAGFLFALRTAASHTPYRDSPCALRTRIVPFRTCPPRDPQTHHFRAQPEKD